jgi:hypothetical protein
MKRKYDGDTFGTAKRHRSNPLNKYASDVVNNSWGRFLHSNNRNRHVYKKSLSWNKRPRLRRRKGKVIRYKFY